MIAVAIVFLEVLFAVGIIGAAIVIVLTAIEDVHSISKVEDEPQPRSSSPLVFKEEH